jgi:hypothetical protein
VNLRFVWHIFRKDTRRLWWMIALTLALLARLAHQDSWRNVATPDIEEGWFNVLLPLAWSLLIALVILEDPPVGEAPFWETVPCPRRSLLTAKAAFVAAFIHIPYFIACVFIVNARGFAPVDYLAVLFGRQLALLALTLPAVTLATVVGNVTQFMIVAIALAAAIAAPSFPSVGMDSPATHRLREIVLLSCTSITALWVAIAQYGRNRTSATRWLGITVIWIAVLIWGGPHSKFDGLQAILSPASPAIGQPSIHLSGPDEPREPRQGFALAARPSTDIRAAIPLTVSGFAPGYSAHFGQRGMQWQTPEGQSLNASAALQQYPLDIPTWQLLAIDKKIFDQIKDTPIDLEGTANAAYYRLPRPVWTSVDKNITIAGLGNCSTEIVGDNPNDQMLKVGCESPNQLPVVRLRLLDPATNRDWKQTLGGSAMFQDYPTSTWLSPVDRRVTYFPLIDEDRITANSLRWQLPREIMQSLKIAIRPEFPAGTGVLHYKLPDIKLNQYGVEK